MPNPKSSHAKEAIARAATDADCNREVGDFRRHSSEGDHPKRTSRLRWSFGWKKSKLGKSDGGSGDWGHYALRSSISKTPTDRLGSNGGIMDLDSCIDIIETVGEMNGLTFQQRRAIQTLRSFASELSLPREIIDVQDSHQVQNERRSFARRGVIVGKKGSFFLADELSKWFQELSDNKDDAVSFRNSCDVLSHYGGKVVDSALRVERREESRSPVMKGGDPVGALHDPALRLATPSGKAAEKTGQNGEDPERHSSLRRDALVKDYKSGLIPRDARSSSIERSLDSESDHGSEVYCPPEWNALTMKTRSKLTHVLSWDNLSQWEFNIVEISELSQDTMKVKSRSGFQYGQCCPLLFVGWAILCAPMAQQAMAGSLGDNADSESVSRSSRGDAFPYHFSDLKINPESVCNFLREVERRYLSENPYHNNIHAADVTQTLHCLLQFIGQENLSAIYSPVDIFSLLLAATFHDIGHPGLNNLYHKNAMTNLAIVHNDVSILENMHSAVGHSLLLGETKQPEWDIFRHFDDKLIVRARSVMISAVLGTDMGNHFEVVGTLDGLVEKVRAESANVFAASSANFSSDQDNSKSSFGVKQELPILSILVRVLGSEIKSEKDESLKRECIHLADSILKFLLHAADISNPAKKLDLAGYWADMALIEFFAQGRICDVYLFVDIRPSL